MEKVTIRRPINLTEEELELFCELDYFKENSQVHQLTNVFITKGGICFQSLNLVKSSVHQYSHLYNKFIKIGLGSFLFKKTVKPPSDKKYLLIHNLWCPGYFHWMIEAIPRLFMVKEKLDELQLVLPIAFKGKVETTLEPFGIKKTEYYDANLKVANLSLPSNPRNLYEPVPEVINALRGHYLSYFKSLTHIRKIDYGSKIYISRKKASARKVINEVEVEKLLMSRGYKSICFEDHSFWEQVSVMQHSKVMISIHGAGLTNMLFMNPGSFIFELYKDRIPGFDRSVVRKSDLPSPIYPRLSSILGHYHLVQFCKPEDPTMPVSKANLIVDIKKLERNLDFLDLQLKSLL